MRIHRRLLGAVAGIVLVGVLPAVASANTSEAIATTGGMTLTIPGVPVTIGVTLDEFGNTSEVVVDDADIETESGDHKVKFTRDTADGSTTIKVKAKESKLTVSFKTSNLAEIVGANVWTADIFGTDDTTTVTFTVTRATGPLGDYGEIKIQLKGKDKRELHGSEVLGDHTWNGTLCDGTTATVSYTVTDDGVTIRGVDVAGDASADIRESDDGFEVLFTDTNSDRGAYVKVELEDEHGTLELKVKSKTTRSCDHDDDD